MLDTNPAVSAGAEIAIYVGMTGMGVHIKRSGQLDPNDVIGRDAQTLGHHAMVVHPIGRAGVVPMLVNNGRHLLAIPIVLEEIKVQF